MKNWKNVLVNIAIFAPWILFLGFGIYGKFFDEKTPDPNAWAFEARRDADEVSYTDMVRSLKSSEAGDQLAIFSDMIVFKDLSPGGASPAVTRTGLNRISAEDLPAQISGGLADVAFLTVPQSYNLAVVLQLAFLLLFLAIMVPIVLRLSGLKDRMDGPYKLIRLKDLTQTLEDVAGLDQARGQIREAVELIKSGGKIGEIGARPPKGLLLDGPPGTGKTLLARAMAKEAGVSFLVINAARLHEMYVGVGPKRVERAFDLARKNAPCIIFIDEVDAVGARCAQGGKVDQERTNLINAFLTQMDGLTPNSGLFIIGATNRPDKLDKAFIRRGRIDRRLTIGLPGVDARVEILKLHAAGLPVAGDVSFQQLAASTPGMSGADLAALCNEAGIAAGRDGAKTVTSAHFTVAREQLILGETGSVTALSPEEREITAWHEAGHAVAATVLPHADPVEHATILPRGGSLGHVLQVPEADRHMMPRAHLVDRMTVLAAGRAAEARVFGEEKVTNGAAADISALTSIAQSMVAEWGMGRFGFVKADHHPVKGYPDGVMPEVRSLARDALLTASNLLDKESRAFEAVAAALLERDTLSGEEIRRIVHEHHSGSPAIADPVPA